MPPHESRSENAIRQPAPSRDPRSWTAPQLRIYGDIRQLTQALLTPKGTPDGMTIGAMILKTGGL